MYVVGYWEEGLCAMAKVLTKGQGDGPMVGSLNIWGWGGDVPGFHLKTFSK